MQTCRFEVFAHGCTYTNIVLVLVLGILGFVRVGTLISSLFRIPSTSTYSYMRIEWNNSKDEPRYGWMYSRHLWLPREPINMRLESEKLRLFSFWCFPFTSMVIWVNFIRPYEIYLRRIELNKSVNTAKGETFNISYYRYKNSKIFVFHQKDWSEEFASKVWTCVYPRRY